jgi:hypothetical protein
MIETIQTTSETINALSALIDEITVFVPRLVMAASVIAAITPPPDPDSRFYPVLSVLDRILNYVAFNIGKIGRKHD